jgi:hypothetical protein
MEEKIKIKIRIKYNSWSGYANLEEPKVFNVH